MSDEKGIKTAADIERELLAAREKELQEETPEPDVSEEMPEPETGEETPEEPDEVPVSESAKNRTAADIEREMLIASRRAPQQLSDSAGADEPRELTAAERERILLNARQAEMAEAAGEDEKEQRKSSSKLGIHNLKKTWKGKLLLVGTLALLILGATAYNFPNLIRSMFSGKDKTEQVDAAGVGAGKSNRLTDLNKDSAFDAPDAQAAATQDVPANGTDTQGKRSASAPAQVVFSRALAQGISSSSARSDSRREDTATNSNASDNRTDTSVQESADSDKKKGLDAIKILPYDPNLFIPENTAIPCSLDRRFVSDLSGKLTCTVNDDIYSASGNVKLIEKGTRASLVYKMGTLKQGQGRAFLIATKLRTRRQPFMDIPLIDSQAAGALGEAGADGWIDTHFWERFGGAMMIGMIPDISQWASGAAQNNKDDRTDYTANSREAFAEIAKEAFANSVNMPPTMYKNQGEIITLITGQDLDFSSVYRLKLRK